MPASSVEELYTSTLLGGGVSYELQVRVHSRGCTREAMTRVLHDFKAQCTAIATLRSQQAVLDVIVRRPSAECAAKASQLCTPHFPHDLASTATATRWSRRSVRRARARMRIRNASVRKGTPHVKTRLDLPMRLWYTLQRCLRRRSASRGALLPYSVAASTGPLALRASTARHNHANFIYLHFEHLDTGKRLVTTRVHCILVEPNGPAAAHAYKDGLSRLRRAWAQLVDEGVVVKGMRLQLEPRVRILGERDAHTVKEVERNLHTLIGPRRVSTRRYQSLRGRVHTTTTTHYCGHGAGICGAVTHWIVHKWLSADASRASRASRTLEDVYAELCAWAATFPKAALDELTAFMHDIRTHTRAQYSDIVATALRRDMMALQTTLRTRYSHTLAGGHVVLTCTYTFGLGTERLYHASHEIDVR